MNNSNKVICNYISKELIGELSYRSFAINHGIDESTDRKIVEFSEGKIENYKIPVNTLLMICEVRDVTPSDFLKRWDCNK